MTKPIAQDHQFSKEFLWTIERYERAIEAGIFTEDDKIELLYGKIIELMPAGADHEYCITLLAKFFRRRFGEEFQLREEKSLVLASKLSLPEPDLVVVADINYSRKKPTAEEVFLVAEVASTSLVRDRTIKVALYAEANLAEYWIVNLVNRQIEVHLKPNAEQGVYGSVNIYTEGSSFTSPFAGEVTVADLLPDQEEE
ncbi:MAG: Uma2 family endonuclease [Bacteroidota bacterium]